MTTQLQNKVAVIMGGGSWIGKEIAKKYAREGAQVFIAGRTLSTLQETVNEILKEGGIAAYAVVDIRNETQMSDFLKKVEAEHHRVDIFVNSAAIYPFTSIDELSLQEWKEVIDTNLTGSFIAIKHAANMMKKNQTGKIILISSIAGEKLGIKGLAHYGASKAGMNGLMRAAAIELAPYGICVNSISPGNIVNKERFHINETTMNEMTQSIPLGRVGQPNDVANLAVFLASDGANFITGQDYVIDGGEIISQ